MKQMNFVFELCSHPQDIFCMQIFQNPKKSEVQNTLKVSSASDKGYSASNCYFYFNEKCLFSYVLNVNTFI